ncbi:MAG: thiamine-monophosphate kinase [Candidatus Omnitrophica bacterium]|nr:thiamine-monophosphate kinase [Candidatus Omnitrophota bacterium]
MSNRGTTLKEIGEFGLIARIGKWARCDRSVLCGIGDDAAVLRGDLKQDLLLAADMLIEDRHFRIGEATPFEIGWKAVAVNISDIAAMGGVPRHLVVSVGLPDSLSLDFIGRMYRGMRAVSRLYGVNLVGGDTNRADRLVVSVAILGEVPRGRAVLRSGARAGDVIFVTGGLGGSYRSGKHLRFRPRLKESRFLVRRFGPHAMIDVSDGVASDLRRICEASHVGAVLSHEAIPLNPGVPSVERALGDGEDFELLFCLPPGKAARLAAHPPKGLGPFHPIGKIVPKSLGVKILREGRVPRDLGEGFDHFK